VAAVEVEDQSPALDGGFDPVHGPVHREESVAGVLEGVESCSLPSLVSSASICATSSGDGFLSSAPKSPRMGHEIFDARSMIGSILNGSSGGDDEITNAP
jgi:hypothetical protein